MEKVDYLIVGQGIAGSLLAYELMQAGQRVFVLNEEKETTSSNKAAGIYNPITGRKLVKTWLADALFMELEAYYLGLEQILGTHFVYPMPIYRPFFSFEEQNDWSVKASEPEYAPYVKELRARSMQLPGVIDPVGGLVLDKCGYVNLPVMLRHIKKYFLDKGAYRAEVFQYDQMTINEREVTYKDIVAERVIFCEGPMAVNNPYWNELPFKLVKGEILEVDSPLPTDLILNRGVFVLPKNGHFSVGSTYDHTQLDYEPSVSGIKNLKDRLGKLYQGEYTVVSTSAGVRPATFDRRPFIGFHQDEPQIGIFNGFGTKGVSLVPYFARQLVNYLSGVGEIIPEVNVSRVIK
ncbi:MAG: FAD-dependent oxidoreductase [Marinoscillum sp.]|uniref:NAD(P)/FAD-dependent oxidoreductase n=1 Tax=Marinoscillum sp. TaxID=2024838 RepID=UPI0032F7BF94